MTRRGAGGTGWTGRRGERIAATWLRRRGYRITGRNIRRGSREVDLLGTSPDGRLQVVIEVKSGCGTFEQLAGRVDAGKRRRICSVAARLPRGTSADTVRCRPGAVHDRRGLGCAAPPRCICRILVKRLLSGGGRAGRVRTTWKV